MKYVHTNLVARDWRKLSDFYIKVFNCKPVPPERDLSGGWLDDATSLEDAHITGMHLRLPGYADGPTLELFQYDEETEASIPYPNSPGYGHIVKMGGSWVGELTRIEIKGVGVLVFAYMRDPEGNIIEIQSHES